MSLPPGTYSGFALSAESPPRVLVINGTATGTDYDGEQILSMPAIVVDQSGYPTVTPNETAYIDSSGGYVGIKTQALWLTFDQAAASSSHLCYLCYTASPDGGTWTATTTACTNTSCLVEIEPKVYVQFAATMYDNFSASNPDQANIPALNEVWIGSGWGIGSVTLQPSALQPYEANANWGDITQLGQAADAGLMLYAFSVSLYDGSCESELMQPTWCWNAQSLQVASTSEPIHAVAQYNMYVSNGSAQFYYMGSCSPVESQVYVTIAQLPPMVAVQTPSSQTRTLSGLVPQTGQNWDGSTNTLQQQQTNGVFQSNLNLPLPLTVATPVPGRLLPGIPVNQTYGGANQKNVVTTDGLCIFDLTPTSWGQSGLIQCVFSLQWPFGGGAPVRVIQAAYDSNAKQWTLTYYNETGVAQQIPFGADDDPLELNQVTYVMLYVHQAGDNTMQYVTLFQTSKGNGQIQIDTTLFQNKDAWLAIPPPSGNVWDNALTSGGWALCDASLLPNPTSGNAQDVIDGTYTVANYTTMSAEQATCQASQGGFRSVAGLIPPGNVSYAYSAGVTVSPNCPMLMLNLCTAGTTYDGYQIIDNQTCCAYRSNLFQIMKQSESVETAAEIAGCFAAECTYNQTDNTSSYKPSTACGGAQCQNIVNVEGNYDVVSQVAQTTYCHTSPNSNSNNNTPTQSLTWVYVSLAVFAVAILWLAYSKRSVN